ncbi:MAG: hypothetical protein U1F50_16980 [Rubrivivax sp.]
MAPEPLPAVEALARAHAAQAPVQLGLLQSLHVISLRHLDAGGPGDPPPPAAAHWPAPGDSCGDDPCLLWRSPNEALALTQDAGVAARMLEALAPGREPLRCAVDLSQALQAVELSGPGIDVLMPRLLDAGALPRRPGAATRSRCADLAVTLLRRDAERLWLLVERPDLDFMALWLLEACERLGAEGRLPVAMPGASPG